MKFRKQLSTLILIAATSSTVHAASTQAISKDSSGKLGIDASNSPRIDYSGRYVVFESKAKNITGSTIQQVVRTDRNTDTTTIVSRSSSGAIGNLYSHGIDISDDGSKASFTSYATNLTNENYAGNSNIFYRDITSGTTIRVTRSALGGNPNGDSTQAVISGDGKWIAFVSYATNLTNDNVDGKAHIYLYEVATGNTRLVSKSHTGAPGNQSSITPAINYDGNLITYSTLAGNLSPKSDQNGQYDIYAYNRDLNSNELVSQNDAGTIGNKKSSSPIISNDGRFIAFHSFATNLDLSFNTSSYNIFMRDRQNGETRLISRSGSSLANGFSFYAGMSKNGRFISYISRASNLVNGDTNSGYDLFVYDRILNSTEILSRNSTDSQINGSISFVHEMNGDGSISVFASAAPNLNTNNIINIFARDRGPVQNLAPVANAGPDRTVQCSGALTTVFLDASSSYDMDGNIASYNWSDGYMSINSSTADFSATTGTHQYELTVTDDSNNSDNDFINITVVDNEPPVLHMALAPQEATSANGATYPWDFTAASDNCSTPTISITPLQDIYPLGTTDITITVTDGQNTAKYYDQVVVVDTIAPAFSAQIPDITIEATGPQTPVSLTAPVASDLFDVTYSSDAQASYALGDYIINWSATDTSDNATTAQQNLSIVDTTAPVLNLGVDIVLEANSKEGAAHTITPVEVSDACQCGQLTLEYQPQLAVYPLGTSVVKATVTDQSGNSTTDDISITVKDTTAPVVTQPAMVSAEATGKLTAVTLTNPQASDLFDLTYTNDAPAGFALGKTTVTWTVTDKNGNSATTTQIVNIVDTTAPTIEAGQNVILEATSSAGAKQSITPVISDICDCGEITLSYKPALDVYPLGKTNVVVTATDQSGNSASDSITIEVVDTTPPEITAPASIQVEATGTLTLVTPGMATATDFFGANVSNDSTGLFPVGTTQVTWTAVDGNGNIATALQTVTVVDTTAPEFTIDLLKDELWPPRHRLIHAANVTNIKDLVDESPIVEITVTTEDSHKKRHRHKFKKENWEIIDSGDHWEIWLRASKLIRSKEDRIYAIEVSVTDKYNNQNVQTAEVSVPHSRKHHHDHKDKKHKKVAKKHKDKHDHKDKKHRRNRDS